MLVASRCLKADVMNAQDLKPMTPPSFDSHDADELVDEIPYDDDYDFAAFSFCASCSSAEEGDFDFDEAQEESEERQPRERSREVDKKPIRLDSADWSVPEKPRRATSARRNSKSPAPSKKSLTRSRSCSPAPISKRQHKRSTSCARVPSPVRTAKELYSPPPEAPMKEICLELAKPSNTVKLPTLQQNQCVCQPKQPQRQTQPQLQKSSLDELEALLDDIPRTEPKYQPQEPSFDCLDDLLADLAPTQQIRRTVDDLAMFSDFVPANLFAELATPSDFDNSLQNPDVAFEQCKEKMLIHFSDESRALAPIESYSVVKAPDPAIVEYRRPILQIKKQPVSVTVRELDSSGMELIAIVSDLSSAICLVAKIFVRKY